VATCRFHRHVFKGQERESVLDEQPHQSVRVEDEVVPVCVAVADHRVHEFDLVGLVEFVKGVWER